MEGESEGIKTIDKRSLKGNHQKKRLSAWSEKSCKVKSTSFRDLKFPVF